MKKRKIINGYNLEVEKIENYKNTIQNFRNKNLFHPRIILKKIVVKFVVFYILCL